MSALDEAAIFKLSEPSYFLAVSLAILTAANLLSSNSLRPFGVNCLILSTVFLKPLAISF